MAKRAATYRDHVPVVEKLYRRQQASYASAGGFLLDDDDDDGHQGRGMGELEEWKGNNCRPSTSDELLAPPASVTTGGTANDDHLCTVCGKPIVLSYLWDKFRYPVCDQCRDGDGAHKLITRTEAKSNYLLKDCDIDRRVPPLRCISKKNPHNPRYGDMRLYLKIQMEQRALDVWESWEQLEDAKRDRSIKQDVRKEKSFEKKLKTLRDEVRGNAKTKADRIKPHEHQYAEETYDAEEDQYSKHCTLCDHKVTYEKL